MEELYGVIGAQAASLQARGQPALVQKAAAGSRRACGQAARAPGYRFGVSNVLQLRICPESKPVRNQRWRWAEEPCVNYSGDT